MESDIHNHARAILDVHTIINAVIAMFLMSVTSSIIGSYLVSNRIVFIGGGIAHCAYGGIGLSIFTGISTLLGSAVSVALVALILSYVKQKMSYYMDRIMALLWALGMSLGVLLMDMTGMDPHQDIEGYLFGSLLTVTDDLVMYMVIFNVLLVIFFVMYYKDILYLSYDVEFCRMRNIPVGTITTALFMFISIGLVLAMQVSGLIMVLAVISIPAYNALLFSKNLLGQMILSLFFSLFFMFSGFTIAIRFDINVGATITLISVLSIIVSYTFLYLKRYSHGKRCKKSIYVETR